MKDGGCVLTPACLYDLRQELCQVFSGQIGYKSDELGGQVEIMENECIQVWNNCNVMCQPGEEGVVLGSLMMAFVNGQPKLESE